MRAPRSSRGLAAALLITLAFAATMAAAVALGGFGSDAATGEPASPATTGRPATPSNRPAMVPSGEPTGEPSPGHAGVDLRTATGADVHVDLVDATGWLRGAASGAPGDGASVEPYTLRVENADATTLRLTWVDYPIDNDLSLFIDGVDGSLRLVLVQPEPSGPTDAVAFDRVLLVSFDRPVDAGAVEAFLQDGLDT